MKKMYGIVTPIVTPFDDNGNVDLECTRKLVNYLIEHKVNGLYPCGTTGEMLKMSVEERKIFAKTVVDEASGRVPVWIQVGCANTADTLELAKHAVEIGSDGIGVITPQFHAVTDDELATYYITVAKAVPDDFPVYLYGIPQCAVNDISAEVADRVARECKNVVGLKYSKADFVRMKDFLLCNDGNFDVIIGPDRLILPGLAMGCKGTVSGCSQCCPEPFVEEYEAFVHGDLEGARKAFFKACELCEIVTSCANIGYVKAALEINGVFKSHMRAPALDLSPEEKAVLAMKLNAFKQKYGYID